MELNRLDKGDKATKRYHLASSQLEGILELRAIASRGHSDCAGASKPGNLAKSITIRPLTRGTSRYCAGTRIRIWSCINRFSFSAAVCIS